MYPKTTVPTLQRNGNIMIMMMIIKQGQFRARGTGAY